MPFLQGSEVMKTPVHLYVSRASPSAIAAIEAVGGSVTTRYYSKFAIRHILQGKIHPIHSRRFIPTLITHLYAEKGKEWQYDLPDPIARKDLEYYRDIRHRGYLSYEVPLGHTPSLYFRTPGTGILKKTIEKTPAAKSDKGDNRLW
jgi:large subunit ribosomal protein L15